VDATVEWDTSVLESERCGMLFQQGVLIDSLTVRENIALSLNAANLPVRPWPSGTDSACALLASAPCRHVAVRTQSARVRLTWGQGSHSAVIRSRKCIACTL